MSNIMCPDIIENTIVETPKGSQFLIIDKYIPPWRGGAMTRRVSRLETYWIHQLQTYSPFGLNIEWDINDFISQA